MFLDKPEDFKKLKTVILEIAIAWATNNPITLSVNTYTDEEFAKRSSIARRLRKMIDKVKNTDDIYEGLSALFTIEELYALEKDLENKDIDVSRLFPRFTPQHVTYKKEHGGE